MPVPTFRILLTGLTLSVLIGCRFGGEHVSAYAMPAGLDPRLDPARDESAARIVAGNFVAHHVLGTASPARDSFYRIEGICLDRIRWDSTFTFGEWEPERWMDLPASQDIRFAEGPLLRIKFTGPRWFAFPIYGDTGDIPWECKSCLDSAFVETLRRSCR